MTSPSSQVNLYELDDDQLSAYEAELAELRLLAEELELPGLRASVTKQMAYVYRENIARVEAAIEAWREENRPIICSLNYRETGPFEDALSRAIEEAVISGETTGSHVH